MESKIHIIYRYKWAIISVAAVLLVLFILFGANMILFWNLAIGKDTVVRLASAKTEIHLVHGDEENISIEASVITNPFCSAECSYNFIDISSNISLGHDRFVLKASSPIIKEYTLKADSMAEGISLYRFDMECASNRTYLCRTSQSPSTRTLIITVRHSLSDDEKEIVAELKSDIISWLNASESMLGMLAAANNTLASLFEAGIGTNMLQLSQAASELDSEISQLETMSDLWSSQQFNYLLDMHGSFQESITGTSITVSRLQKSINGEAASYNSIISSLNESRAELAELAQAFIANSTLAREIDDAVQLFNNAVSSLSAFSVPDIIESNLLASLISNKTGTLSSIQQELSYRESVSRGISLIISADALCLVSGVCYEHPNISDVGSISLASACESIDSFIQLASSAFTPLNLSSDDDILPEDLSAAAGLRANITCSYLLGLPAGAPAIVIAELNTSISSPMPSFENTTGLIKEIIRQVEQCKRFNTTYTPVGLNLSHVVIYEPVHIALNISLGEPAPICCIWGNCSHCCTSSQCAQDPGTYPVVLLHGHAISKAISAEYSLEGFTKLQNKLESGNYLNAGTITMYSEKPAEPGLWGMFSVPVTLRASFYFDFFRQPDSHTIVQAMSENIDTYAIRLKELVDSIKYRTGKDKVILVPFSMGGLVARRYLQLFGSDDVHKLILIGVPNHGISGRIASLCPLTGEQKECRDMQSGSLFMSKLNSASLPGIPVYNIVGTGCDMEGSSGDGAVLEKSALLEGANNFIISGTCRTLTTPLHLDLLDPEMYPQVYGIIKAAIGGK